MVFKRCHAFHDTFMTNELFYFSNVSLVDILYLGAAVFSIRSNPYYIPQGISFVLSMLGNMHFHMTGDC